MGLIAETYAPVLSTLAFIPRKYSYYLCSGRAVPDSTLKQALDTLRTDGVVLIERFLPVTVIREFTDALPPRDNFLVSPEGTLGLYYPNADRIAQLSRFFSDPRLHSLATGHMSRSATQLRRSAQWKHVHGPVESFEMHFHMDTWKYRLKAFLYLDAVSPCNGAMQYLVGSHRGAWRLPHEALLNKFYRTSASSTFAADEEVLSLGSLWPYQVGHLQRKYGLKILTCSAPAGSLLVFDARGLHRARPLHLGERRLLSSYWIVKDQHV
jgi:hypothetical protein